VKARAEHFGRGESFRLRRERFRESGLVSDPIGGRFVHWALFWGLLLLPVPFSRVVLNDHTPLQVTDPPTQDEKVLKDEKAQGFLQVSETSKHDEKRNSG